jgi:hypothetical protein
MYFAAIHTSPRRGHGDNSKELRRRAHVSRRRASAVARELDEGSERPGPPSQDRPGEAPRWPRRDLSLAAPTRSKSC